MFEIYTKTVDITTPSGVQKLTLRPLSGRFLPKLYTIFGTFSKVKAEEDMGTFMESLDEPTVAKLHDLVFETLKKSYPAEDPLVLDEFTSQNLMALMPALIEVNLNTKAA